MFGPGQPGGKAPTVHGMGRVARRDNHLERASERWVHWGGGNTSSPGWKLSWQIWQNSSSSSTTCRRWSLLNFQAATCDSWLPKICCSYSSTELTRVLCIPQQGDLSQPCRPHFGPQSLDQAADDDDDDDDKEDDGEGEDRHEDELEDRVRLNQKVSGWVILIFIWAYHGRLHLKGKDWLHSSHRSKLCLSLLLCFFLYTDAISCCQAICISCKSHVIFQQNLHYISSVENFTLALNWK